MKSKTVVGKHWMIFLWGFLISILMGAQTTDIFAAEAKWLWPVPSSTTINQRWNSTHGGLDIGGAHGCDIVASKSGTVLKELHGDETNYGGYGNGIVIDHGDGWYSHYAHMSATYVSQGQSVTQGQRIGAMGATGNATGTHLHFAIKTGSQGPYGGASGSIDNNKDVLDYIYTPSGKIWHPGSDLIIRKTKDGLWLYGWAFDPNRPTTPVTITVVIGGPFGTQGAEQITLGQTHEHRSDINNGIGTTGFNKTIHTGRTGDQPVYVYADIGGEQYELITSRTMNVGSMPIGNVESVVSGCAGTIKVVGWALDADFEGYSSRIAVCVGPSNSREDNYADINGNTMIAGELRQDVNNAYNGTVGDYHGYSYFIPTTKTGTQTVEVWALNVGNGYDIPIGERKTVTISTEPHSFVNESVKRAATTTLAGSMEHSCSKCGFKETETIPQIAGMTLGTTSYTYDGYAKKPSVIVKDANGATIPSSNYTVSYTNNVNPGTATATVTFKGSKYSGELRDTFEIKSVVQTVPVPTGKTFTFNGKKRTGVAAGNEYTISGNTGTNAKTYKATLTLTDKTNYVWSDGTTEDKTVNWTIKPASLASAVVIDPIADQYFTGSSVKASYSLSQVSTSVPLPVEGTDYDVAYKNTKKVGTATLTLTGINNFTGTVSQTYKIVYRPVKTEFKTKTGVYKITKAGPSGTAEVAYKEPASAKATEQKIPATVTYKSVSYKVTSIAANALRGNTYVKMLTIGKNVAKIGNRAFYGCVDLRYITILTNNLTSTSHGSSVYSKTHKKAQFTVPGTKLKSYKKWILKAGASENSKFVKK